jgi:hypothetical protein
MLDDGCQRRAAPVEHGSTSTTDAIRGSAERDL